jgi:integrase
MPRKRRRRWGSGSLLPGEGGRWRIRWKDADGRHSKSFASKDTAEQVLSVVLRNVERGEAGLPRDRTDAPTLDELATPWLDRRVQTHRAASDDRLRWKNHLNPVFGKMRAGDVNAAKLRAFIEAKLAEGLAPTTVGHCIRHLSTFFEDVKEQGHVDVNPVSTLPRSTRRLYKSIYDTTSTPFLEHRADIERLYRALPEPHNVILILGALTGCRVGELLGMQWRDVDFAAGKIHVRQQVQDGKLCQLKDKESRFVPLATDLLPVLEAWKLKTGGVGQLFRPAVHDRGGRPDLGTPPGFVRSHTVHKALAEALKKCELPKLTLYQCTRHTYASQWSMAGGSLEELARYMGHASTSTTAHYSHLAPGFFGPKARDMVRVDLAAPKGDVISIHDSDRAGDRNGAFMPRTAPPHEDNAVKQLSLSNQKQSVSGA